MAVEYRPLTADDIEQAVKLEARAFYNEPTPERVEQMRRVLPPDWTVGAFVDGRIVADVRTIPMARRMNGGATTFGCVGPVTCAAEFRRQGHVGKLLRLSLERMREQGIALSGLHTPHDGLYQRYGWERAEGKKQYRLRAKDVRLRVRPAPGSLRAVGLDDWRELDDVYRRYASDRNGPLHRPEAWWRESIFPDFESRKVADAFLWLDAGRESQGFVVYRDRPRAWNTEWDESGSALMVRDMVSLNGDAYLNLWQHLLGHDLANPIIVDTAPNDPFPELVDEPWKVEVRRIEGAMIRIVDVERALASRRYAGRDAVGFTLRVRDESAPWNDGVWRIEAAEGRTSVERADGAADLETSANFLAPLYTGKMRPDHAAAVGMLKVNRPEALQQAVEAFAVSYPPFSHDWY